MSMQCVQRERTIHGAVVELLVPKVHYYLCEFDGCATSVVCASYHILRWVYYARFMHK